MYSLTVFETACVREGKKREKKNGKRRRRGTSIRTPDESMILSTLIIET